MGLHLNGSYVLHGLGMTLGNATVSIETRASYGAHLLDHLAADGAGFPGSQVTIVAVGQVDTHFGSGLHLELVHCLTSLGNVDLIVALHTKCSPFVVFRKAKTLSGGKRLFFPHPYLFPE